MSYSNDVTGGSHFAEISWEDSQLCRALREAPVLLDWFPSGVKVDLAATCWGALELVLRDTRAVLRVHPADPVLAGLTKRLTGGPCAGQVTLCGVRVSATDAWALLAASQGLGFDLPTSVAGPYSDFQYGVANSEGWSRAALDAWVDLVLTLALAGEFGDVHVTGLIVPTPSHRPMATEEAEAVAEVLRTRAVKDSLRSLKLAGERAFELSEEAVGVLHGAMRGLTALQHLCNLWPSRAGLVDGNSCLTTLDLSEMEPAPRFGPASWGALFSAVQEATKLRSLKLPDWADSSVAEDVWGLPAGLEVLCLESTCPLRWWEATNLRSLEFHRDVEMIDDAPVWRRLAESIDRSKNLRRLVIGDVGWPADPGQVLAVFSALERSNVEELSILCPCLASLGATAALTAALVSALREMNLTLIDSAMPRSPLSQYLRNPGTWPFPGMSEHHVVMALHDKPTLRELRLDWSRSEGFGAALGDLLGRNTSLVRLYLSDVQWTETWPCELFQGLSKNRTLQVLGMSGFSGEVFAGWARENVFQLMDALYGGDRHNGRQLHTLEIASAHICNVGVEHIAAFLEKPQSSKLRRLALCVYLLERGAAAIARALERNCSLVSLELGGHVQWAGYQRLAASLVQNTTLRHLEITSGRDNVPRAQQLAKQLLHAQRYAAGQRQKPVLPERL